MGMLADMVRRKTPWCALFGLLVFDAACSSTWPQVMDPSDIVSLREGTPKISRVADLGSPHIGKPGPMQPSSDGNITIGELVLIQGSGFGKQPTVSLGGRPAEIRWRTDGGGLIVQVPSGVSTGTQPLVVEAAGKRAETSVSISRLAVVLDGPRGLLHALRVSGGSGQQPVVEGFGQPLAVKNARSLAVSSDGAAAYVLVQDKDHDEVAIVDLTAPSGPAIRDQRRLKHRAATVLAASAAPVVAIVGDSDVTVWDASEAVRPSPWPAAALPIEARGATLFSLDSTGTLLAAGFPEPNEVALYDIRPTRTEVTPKEVARATVLPLARQPLLHDVRFSADGEQLWTLSGDPSSGKAQQPTQLVALSIGPKEAGGIKRTLSVGKPVEIKDGGAPLSLTVGRSRPIASGATIRAVPERSQVILATAPRADGPKSLSGSIFRVAEGGVLKSVLSGGQIFASVDVSPDAGLAIAAEQSKEGPLSVTVADTEVHATASFTLGSKTQPGDNAKVELWVQP